MDDLQQFLASEAAQGLWVEEGGFSLTPEKALEKLSLFSLPTQGTWVLKLLQAAVVVGAPEIRFSFQRRLVSVEFDNLANWDAQALLTLLLSAQTSEDSAQRHLITGILGAALGFSEVLEWACGETRVRVDKGGPIAEPCTLDSTFRLTATRPKRSAFSVNALSSPITYLIRQTVHEYKALVDQGGASPIPIVIDKLRWEGSYQVPTRDLPREKGYDSENSDGTCILLGQLPVGGLARPNLAYPIDSAPLEHLEDQREKLGSIRVRADGPIQAVVCVHACLQRCSRVNFMMDGVLLESRLLQEEPQLGPLLAPLLTDTKDDFVLDVYFAVDWADLDLSQFKVREGPPIRDMAALVPSIRALLETLHREAEKRWEFSNKPPVERKLPSLSVGSLIGGAFLSMFIPHFLVLGGFFGAVYVGAKVIGTVTPAGMMWESLEHKMHLSKATAFRERIEKTLAGLDGVEARLAPG